MWMRKTAHSHSLSFLFFSFLPKTHDGGCAIVRPGCRVFFFFQNTYKKAPPAQEISPARKEPYCFFTVILWSQPAGKRIIHTPKQDWNASVPKPPSWREVAFASANDGGSKTVKSPYQWYLGTEWWARCSSLSRFQRQLPPLREPFDHMILFTG